MRRIEKSIVGAVVGFIVFAALAAAVQNVYYRVLPGSWFLNYYYAKVDNALVGQNVQMTLCRTKRIDYIQAEATRLFISTTDGRSISEYRFNLTIDGQERCTSVQIPVSRQPQIPGTYIIRTSGAFYVQGNRKTFNYSSLPYVVSVIPGSVQDRINQLQQQINDLQQVRATPRTPIMAPVTSLRLTSQTPTQPAAVTSTATSPAPDPVPTPEASQPPANPPTPLSAVLTLLQNTTNGLNL